VTTRINIASASVVLALVVGAPIASAAKGTTSTAKHHTQPSTSARVQATENFTIPSGCVSTLIDEYLTIYNCNS
jgi:hypothetical protein